MDFKGIAEALNTPNSFTKAPVFEAKKEIWTYECPLCRNRVRFDSDMEPCCTGPGFLDSHPIVVMRLAGKQVDGRVL